MKCKNRKSTEENVYNIIEVANVHAGDFSYIDDLIEKVIDKYNLPNFGIKFQPLSADMIATQDFEWYQVYKEIEFNSNEWQLIINKASTNIDVWLDMFDLYSTQILENNLSKIFGIKLQASVLKNYPLINHLSTLDLSDKKIIINISGYEISDITPTVNYINDLLNCEEVILQVGFQSYPTRFIDSGLNKIDEIKRVWEGQVCFADHADSSSQEAFALPLLAMEKGCKYIEKHVLLSERDTKYDYQSSFSLDQYNILIDLQNKISESKHSSFITSAEREYLDKTYQIPILKNNKSSGDLISVQSDFDYRRSGKVGINTLNLEKKIKSKYVLSNDLLSGEALQESNFKKANIGTIVACRMKSSRLKNKATLKIGNLSSIENCLLSCKKFNNVSHLVLATSTHGDDLDLKNFCLDSSVLFRRGSEEDVITRYLDVANELKLDVIIRVTGDMPFVSSEIANILLDSHFENGADFTCAVDFSVGTACEIISVNALKRVKGYIEAPSMSEYMSYYFTNNEHLFRVNRVRLPEKFVRSYRLTIDYQEDLDMMNKLLEVLDDNGMEVTIENIFSALDESNISAINEEISLVYKTDKALIDKLKRETRINLVN